MITRMAGVVNRVLDEEVRLQVGPFEYQILIPEFVRRQVQTRTGEQVDFHIIEYLEANQMSSRMVPRKIGFLAEVEQEFFELFCTVDKIGVKKALKAMGRPIKEIADAIQRKDAKWLTTLPGIGKQTADQVVATLNTKVTKFALMPVGAGEGSGPIRALDAVLFEDAYAALMSVGLSPAEAKSKLDLVIMSGKEVKTVEDIIGLVFRKGE